MKKNIMIGVELDIVENIKNEGSISNKKEVEEKINKKDKKIQKRRREKDENKNKINYATATYYLLKKEKNSDII